MTFSQFAYFLRRLSGISSSLTIEGMTNFIANASPENLFNDGYFISRGLSKITIPSNVTEIGIYAFAGCALNSVTIPSSVRRIGSGAFERCNALTSITIPASVAVIDITAFNACTALTSITLPAGITYIGTGAFQGCDRLTNIYCGFTEGSVSGAPWGAYRATVHYNSAGPA